jgi:hypothetical protein
MNRFLFAKHAEDRAPGGLQQNANLFLHEPLVVFVRGLRPERKPVLNDNMLV